MKKKATCNFKVYLELENYLQLAYVRVKVTIEKPECLSLILPHTVIILKIDGKGIFPKRDLHTLTIKMRR